mmetsp:Transcript_6922/g.9039  ORF Transcript_6922/g.9039 Transcript_6922/m.9039 type:complete len:197 (-) Transcript_6922:95-685(-)
MMRSTLLISFLLVAATCGTTIEAFAFPSSSRPVTNTPPDTPVSRRALLGKTAFTISTLWILQPTPVLAKLKPEDAFAALVAAREELRTAGRTYLSNPPDYEGLRDFLNKEAVNLNAYESNAGALLESKRLDVESKKEIGTIRRYGVGADVIIMYGGLKTEIDEENDSPSYGEVIKYLKRTGDALDEVIAICRSNGL